MQRGLTEAEVTQPSGPSVTCRRVTIWTIMKRLLLTGVSLLVRIRVTGSIRPPLPAGYIVALNHLNGADGFVAQIGLGTRLWFLTAHKWFRNRLNRFFMTECLDALPVETGNPLGSLPGLRRSLEILAGGGSIGLFPEGQFNRSGKVGKIEMGAAYLSIRSGKPILPVI